MIKNMATTIHSKSLLSKNGTDCWNYKTMPNVWNNIVNPTNFLTHQQRMKITFICSSSFLPEGYIIIRLFSDNFKRNDAAIISFYVDNIIGLKSNVILCYQQLINKKSGGKMRENLKCCHITPVNNW